MINLIVAGSRDFNDYAMLSRYLNKIHTELGIAKIIQGEARGADLLSKRWAIENNVAHDDVPAEWNKLGNKAGPIRNIKMAEEYNATHLLAFRLNQSRGTSHMISTAREKGLKVMVVDL